MTYFIAKKRIIDIANTGDIFRAKADDQGNFYLTFNGIDYFQDKKGNIHYTNPVDGRKIRFEKMVPPYFVVPKFLSEEELHSLSDEEKRAALNKETRRYAVMRDLKLHYFDNKESE